MQRFQNKVVAITGGNSGIGLAAAAAFAAEGAKVAVFGRDAAALADAETKYGVATFQGDVTNVGDLASFADYVADNLGAIDVLFVNAGIAEFRPVENADGDHFDRVFNVNVKGAFQTIQLCLPKFGNGGSIVLTTSVANELGEPNTSVYAASKSALRSFVQTLSTELLPRGIRVNAVSPGPTDTPIFDKMGLDEGTVRAVKNSIPERIPAGRIGSTRDVAEAVLFLASEKSDFVAGIEVKVDGGFSSSAVMPTT